MHRSLALLRVSEDESNLLSRSRIARLFFRKQWNALLLGIAFLFFGGISLYAGSLIQFQQPLQPGHAGGSSWKEQAIFWACIVLFASAFLGFGIYAWWGILKDPLFGWLRSPRSYEVLSAMATEAAYLPHSEGRKNLDCMRVTFVAKDPSIRIFEDFSTWIWMFTSQENERGLKKGDDWHSLKGKRPTLPFPAFLIYKRADPLQSALIGIPAGPIDAALRVFKSQRRNRLHHFWLLVFLLPILLIGIQILKSWLRTKH